MLKGRGKDDKIPFQIHKVLKEMLDQDVEIHFVRDGDVLNVQWREQLGQFAQNSNVKLHHLDKHEIENYILSPNLFFKTLKTKYPNKNIPSLREIESKILEVLKNTIQLSRYSFDDNLEDSIYKTGVLLNLNEYRNFQNVKSEAKRLRETYETYTDFDSLMRVGMGKETLREIFAWLNGLGCNLSRSDLIAHLVQTDISNEVKLILEQLKSRESKVIPIDDVPEMTEVDGTDENSSEFEEVNS